MRPCICSGDCAHTLPETCALQYVINVIDEHLDVVEYKSTAYERLKLVKIAAEAMLGEEAKLMVAPLHTITVSSPVAPADTRVEIARLNTPMHDLYNTVKEKRDNCGKSQPFAYKRWNELLTMVEAQLNPEKDVIVRAFNSGNSAPEGVAGADYFEQVYNPIAV